MVGTEAFCHQLVTVCPARQSKPKIADDEGLGPPKVAASSATVIPLASVTWRFGLNAAEHALPCFADPPVPPRVEAIPAPPHRRPRQTLGQIAPAGSVGICRHKVEIPNHLWTSAVQDAEGYRLRECRPGHKRMVTENG
jgi:hypothetical protein